MIIRYLYNEFFSLHYSLVAIFMDSSVISKIALWKKLGELFDRNLYNRDDSPYIVILTPTTIKKFQGDYLFRSH